MPKPRPGTFRRLKPGEMPLNPEITPGDFKPSVAQPQVGAYRKFAERYGTPSHVLYPGCGYDKSPSAVFRDVLYIDIDSRAVDALRSEGLDARIQDIKELVPDREFDLLLLMNFNIKEPHLSRLAVCYVIANNYWKAADGLRKNPNFEFVEDLYPELPRQNKSAGYFLFRRA